MEPLELKKAVEDAAKGINDTFEKKMSAQAEEFETKSKELSSKNEALELALKTQGEALAEIQKKGNGTPVDMSIKAQVQKWVEDNKDAIAKIKDGVQPELPQMVIKAAHTMLLSTDAQAPVPYYIAQGAPVIDLVRIQPTFWQRLRKGRTSLPAFPWINKANKEGNAAFIGEGELKPLASFQLVPETSVPKKVAERMKASMELLYDVEGMTSLIEDELRFDVEVAANTAVLSGTASTTSPAGVTTIASAFNLTTLETTNPNNKDVLIAMRAQIRALGYTQPLTAYLNPIDIANMDMTKASDSGIYLISGPDGRRIPDLIILEDNNIPVGFALVGAMDLYRIMMYQDFFIRWGWENDDFSRNLATVIGEMRFHQFVSANHLTAFVYDEIADVKAAITAA